MGEGLLHPVGQKRTDPLRFAKSGIRTVVALCGLCVLGALGALGALSIVSALSKAPAPSPRPPITVGGSSDSNSRVSKPGSLHRATAPTRPTYSITETVIDLVDNSRPTVAFGRELSPHRVLTTQVWIPDAPGRRPLVVFAAGFRAGPSPYRALLEAWARHGYVVAAPEFPLTDEAVAGGNLDEADIANQPADVRFVTDALVAPESPVGDRIDGSKVAVAGHSDGAETALAASIRPPPPGEPVYRALIAMSPQPLEGPASTGNPPILVTQGDADTINPPINGFNTWQEAAAPKYLEVLHGGGHLAPLESGSRWLPALVSVTDAFLDTYTQGDGTPATVVLAGNSPPLAFIRSG